MLMWGKAEEREDKLLWIEKACPLTTALLHFHVFSRYPPDIAHDIMGIVPAEIAQCLSSLNTKEMHYSGRNKQKHFAFPL